MADPNNKSFTNNDLFSPLVCEEIGPGFTIVGLVFILLIMVSCFLGNLLICVAVLKFPYLQSCSEHFIFSLAVSDIMVAVLVLPFDVVYWLSFPRWILGGYACNLWNSLFFLCLTALVLNLACISSDRFLAIVFPLRYTTWMTPKLAKSTITIVWLYSITIGILVFLFLEPPEDGGYSFDLSPVFHSFLLIGNVLFPFIIMIILYFKIYKIARQHAKRTEMTPSNAQSASTFARKLRVAKMLGIIVLCFVLFWLPFEIVNVIIVVDKRVETCTLEIIDTIVCWLAYLHSSLNPFLYALKSTEFRRAFRKLLTGRNASVNIDLQVIHSQSKMAGSSFGKLDQPPTRSSL